MNWTETIPSVEGWYWCIEASCVDGDCYYIEEPVVCEVGFDDDGGIEMSTGPLVNVDEKGRLLPGHIFLWLGPIEVPQPPDGWEKGEPQD